VLFPNRQYTLLATGTISAAQSNQLSPVAYDLAGMIVLICQAGFLYGSGGTSVDAYVQTSFDGGTTWVDIMEFSFTTSAATRLHSVRVYTAVAANYTPTDGTLTANTIKDGLLGAALRAKWSSVGTYAGATSLTIAAVVKGLR